MITLYWVKYYNHEHNMFMRDQYTSKEEAERQAKLKEEQGYQYVSIEQTTV